MTKWKTGDSILLSVKAMVICDESGGGLNFTVIDCVANVFDKDEKIGEIAPAFHGWIELRDNRLDGAPTFGINAPEMWRAFQEALKS